MKYKHSHPINILENTPRYFILLIFPVIRAFFVSGGGIYKWLKGAWFDLLVIAVIALLGIWSWYKYVFALTDSGIYILKGVVFKKERYIPYGQISLFMSEEPFYLMPFKAVRISADTDAGGQLDVDFKVTVKRKDAEDFINKAQRPFVDFKDVKRVYLPKNFYIAVLSFITSNSVTGVVFTSTFISGVGKTLGNEFEKLLVDQITMIARFLAFGLPPILAMIALVILGGWAVSFIMNVLRHLRFTVTRQSKCLHITSGLFTRRNYYVTTDKVNMIEMRQTLITKLCGLYSVFFHVNGYGYGKRRNSLAVLMPACQKHEMTNNLKLLLPEINASERQIKPKLRYLSRFLIPPLSLITVVTIAWTWAYKTVPQFGDVMLYVGIMAEIPCVWYLFVKLLGFFRNGIGENDGVYTLYYNYAYRIKTVVIPKDKAVKFRIRQSVFQLYSGGCDLIVYSYSDGRKRHVISSLNLEQVKEFLLKNEADA